MKKQKSKHFNQKVAHSRGESWKKNLIKGHMEQRTNPTFMRQARVDKGISQISAAKTLKLSPSTYGDIERGKRPAREPVAKNAADMLGLSLKKLFSRSEKGKYLAATRS